MPSFGSWTNHLNYRLSKAKQDGFWDRYNPDDPAFASGYGFMGYNERRQIDGMDPSIKTRNDDIFEMLRNGWSWQQIHDITNGKLDPSTTQADYSDFYKDVGYDSSSGQSLEDAVASGPSWVKDFYLFDKANGAGSQAPSPPHSGGLLGGPITPKERGERKGVWGSGYKDGGYSLLGEENQAMRKAIGDHLEKKLLG